MQRNELVIVAPNIKNGGGKELLNYLLEHIENEYPLLSVTVYLDSSISSIQDSKKRKVVFLESTIDKIILFSKKIDNALYFGNLPPLRKSENSIVYFHNPYLLMNLRILASLSLKLFVKYSLQQLYISFFIKNIDLVACQSEMIKNTFLKKYKFVNLEVLPFFRLCKKANTHAQKEYDFCYVSLAHPHKNHALLFDAMKILSESNVSIRLAVTIEKDNIKLLNEMKKINGLGQVQIDNFGMILKDDICKLYSNSKCLIFPSKEETFGLPLIEAVGMDLDVMAADLEYVYQVIEPSLVFNPYDAKMCADVIKMYMNSDDIKKSHPIVKNEIDVLINKFIG